MKAAKSVVGQTAPDYSRLGEYQPPEAELEALGVESTGALVAALNECLRAQGRPPVTCSDYPTGIRKFAKIVTRYQALREDARRSPAVRSAA